MSSTELTSTSGLPRLDPRRTALLLVDLQNDFCSPGGFFEGAGHDISPCAAAAAGVEELLPRLRPLGVAVVYTKSVRTEPLPHRLRPSRQPLRREGVRAATLGNAMYAPDAWGTQIVDRLLPQEGDLVIEKPRQSPFHRTRLEEELRGRGIDTVAIAGTTTNCCVDCAIRDAFVRDFDVVVLRDCVGAFAAEADLGEATLRNAALFFGVVATADELVEALSQDDSV